MYRERPTEVAPGWAFSLFSWRPCRLRASDVTQLGIASIAIAGAWGYIGRKFLAAARSLGIKSSVFDTGSEPEDLDLSGLVQFHNAFDFYLQQADLFHLALHPDQRGEGMEVLLPRARREPIRVLCEKPMALPECPDQCREIAEFVEHCGAVVLYDFPELFDPLTRRILHFFASFDRVSIESITLQRSKDREDPSNPRNNKRVLHIQYQETVHCLAFILWILAHVRGSLEEVFSDGLMVSAQADKYEPPNPVDYPYVVDGKCEYRMTLGSVKVSGRTDFKRGAPWAKRRTIMGRVDGNPFTIEADYLEGRKSLLINGKRHDDVVDTNSYAEVIKRYDVWCQNVPVHELMQGLYPNPAFARVAYQLSSAMWRSSWKKAAVQLSSLTDLLAFDAGFDDARSGFARYSRV